MREIQRFRPLSRSIASMMVLDPAHCRLRSVYESFPSMASDSRSQFSIVLFPRLYKSQNGSENQQETQFLGKRHWFLMDSHGFLTNFPSTSSPSASPRRGTWRSAQRSTSAGGRLRRPWCRLDVWMAWTTASVTWQWRWMWVKMEDLGDHKC